MKKIVCSFYKMSAMSIDTTALSDALQDPEFSSDFFPVFSVASFQHQLLQYNSTRGRVSLKHFLTR